MLQESQYALYPTRSPLLDALGRVRVLRCRTARGERIRSSNQAATAKGTSATSTRIARATSRLTVPLLHARFQQHHDGAARHTALLHDWQSLRSAFHKNRLRHSGGLFIPMPFFADFARQTDRLHGSASTTS